jgi:hypothetical protein
MNVKIGIQWISSERFVQRYFQEAKMLGAGCKIPFSFLCLILSIAVISID